ncbi:MAG TPA: hypothetical protein VF244_08415 [Acidimicrobiales bacterium]
MVEIEIRFTEREVAQVLTALDLSAELALAADALSTLAFIEDTFHMIRDRFDRRRPDG